jgi:hypothetical protein
LQCPLQVGVVGERGSDVLSGVPIDDVDRRRAHRARGVEDMSQERATRERLQDLRQRRIHALALPGGENDYGNRRKKDDLDDP